MTHRAHLTRSEEQHLVIRARAGDARALSALLHSLDPLLRSLARRHTLPGLDADDLAQEARLAALLAARAPTWRPSPIHPWHSYAGTAVVRHLRAVVRGWRGRRAVEGRAAWEPVEGTGDAEGAMAAREREDWIAGAARQALDACSSEQARVVLARCVEGESVGAVAERMGMGRGAVERIEARGRAAMMGAVGPWQP